MLLVAAAAVALTGFLMPLDSIALLADADHKGSSSRHSLYWHLQTATVSFANHLHDDALSNALVRFSRLATQSTPSPSLRLEGRCRHRHPLAGSQASVVSQPQGAATARAWSICPGPRRCQPLYLSRCPASDARIHAPVGARPHPIPFTPRRRRGRSTTHLSALVIDTFFVGSTHTFHILLPLLCCTQPVLLCAILKNWNMCV